jgi:hypothetical protein
LIPDPSRQIGVDGKKGKSDDGWEVLDDHIGAKGGGVEGHASPRVALNDSVLREEDDQGWDEARREA